jgi:hypothetical protein
MLLERAWNQYMKKTLPCMVKYSTQISRQSSLKCSKADHNNLDTMPPYLCQVSTHSSTFTDALPNNCRHLLPIYFFHSH